jgi:hypothetical protein
MVTPSGEAISVIPQSYKRLQNLNGQQKRGPTFVTTKPYWKQKNTVVSIQEMKKYWTGNMARQEERPSALHKPQG